MSGESKSGDDDIVVSDKHEDGVSPSDSKTLVEQAVDSLKVFLDSSLPVSKKSQIHLLLEAIGHLETHLNALKQIQIEHEVAKDPSSLSHPSLAISSVREWKAQNKLATLLKSSVSIRAVLSGTRSILGMRLRAPLKHHKTAEDLRDTFNVFYDDLVLNGRLEVSIEGIRDCLCQLTWLKQGYHQYMPYIQLMSELEFLAKEQKNLHKSQEVLELEQAKVAAFFEKHPSASFLARSILDDVLDSVFLMAATESIKRDVSSVSLGDSAESLAISPVPILTMKDAAITGAGDGPSVKL